MKTLAFSELLHNNPAASRDNRLTSLTGSDTPTRVDGSNQPGKKINPFRKFLASAKAIALVMILLFSVSMAQAATITSTATGGVWATGGTWVGGVAPTATDIAVIATTGANSVTLGAATTCGLV